MYDDYTVIGDTQLQSATTLPVTTDFSGQQLPNNYLCELVVESNILLLQMLNINYLKINMANFKLKPHSLECLLCRITFSFQFDVDSSLYHFNQHAPQQEQRLAMVTERRVTSQLCLECRERRLDEGVIRVVDFRIRRREWRTKKKDASSCPHAAYASTK